MDVPARAGLRMSKRIANNMVVFPNRWDLARPGGRFDDVGPQIHRTHDPGGRRLRLGRPDGNVMTCRPGPERTHRAVLPPTEQREGVVLEVSHGVGVRDPVDVVVADTVEVAGQLFGGEGPRG